LNFDFRWDYNYKLNEAGLGTDYLISIGVGVDNMNSVQRVIVFDQAGLGLLREYLVLRVVNKEVKNYFRYMVDTAVMLGADQKTAEAELEKSVQFEVDLALMTMSMEQRRNVTRRYNPTTAGAVKTFPGLPPSWTTYLQTLLGLVKEIVIDDNEKIIVNSFEYIEDLAKLINKTEPRVIANYLGWRAAKAGNLFE
jgi:membrane metallo-endopeptidase-like protein 1